MQQNWARKNSEKPNWYDAFEDGASSLRVPPYELQIEPTGCLWMQLGARLHALEHREKHAEWTRTMTNANAAAFNDPLSLRKQKHWN